MQLTVLGFMSCRSWC